MRKVLKAATLMGLAAALLIPAPSKADDSKITISGQLRERVEWWNNYQIIGNFRARIKLTAKLADGVTAVFTPQAVGFWGENRQGLILGERTSAEGVSGETNNVNMHEAYMLLSNPFGIEGAILKIGRQEVNLGNQRLVGSVGWSQAGRSLDGILAGYSSDYGLAAVFYGKLNDTTNRFDAWVIPNSDANDTNLFVATWQGKLNPFGIGGTYEVTDIYVNGAGSFNINTLYGRVTPVIDLGAAKAKANVEAAFQSGDDGSGNNYGGYFFSVGGGATFTDVVAKPSVFVGYDYYSGDDGKDNDIDAFWSVLPTAHKWLGFADQIWAPNFYKFNGAFPTTTSEGITDLYVKLSAKPLAKVATLAHVHYFQTAEDNDNSGKTAATEVDLQAKYKYSKNLCFTIGYEFFNPDDALGNGDSIHHLWLQADLKF
jgi:hypothetical protein